MIVTQTINRTKIFIISYVKGSSKSLVWCDIPKLDRRLALDVNDILDFESIKDKISS